MENWNAAMDHIEAHLAERIDVAALARQAAVSEHHFRRMFATLAGIPLSEYIRRRRMTVAAAELRAGAGVLDTGLRFGYGSGEAFTRAFRSVHGCTPSQARMPGTVLRSQPRLRFRLTIEGREHVDYRIVKKGEFRLAGLRTRVPIVALGPNTAIEEFERGIALVDRAELERLADGEPTGSLAVTEHLDGGPGESSEVAYWRAVVTGQDVPERFETAEVAASEWLVLSAEGEFPEALQQMWATAAAEWFPANPYSWAPGPQLLSVEYDGTGDGGRGELWIPIRPEG
ncbi:AraC family transcriptional regulator [Brevibacterium album]|uniref:AraC family transcriptional regulator n=1 Tax=Brevibacterium album TaxID=417948 RepID=UPI0003FCB31A|nr:AraC family transcriptional regulator [Brevibacterium album]